MSTELIIALISSSVLGGLLVAIANHFFTKEKVRAEADKIIAEAEKIKVETKKVLNEIEYENVERNLRYTSQAPEGWSITGDDPFSYKIGVDKTISVSGGSSAFIESIRKTSSFAGLLQTAKVGSFQGKRIRMSGWVRSEDVKGWAGLWFRVDAPTRKAIGFDNMVDRPIKGTNDWAEYHIVLDIAEHAYKIAYGIVLIGEGKIWIDKIRFEDVGTQTPITDQRIEFRLPESPSNLDFDP